jgi:hypothetical protein
LKKLNKLYFITEVVVLSFAMDNIYQLQNRGRERTLLRSEFVPHLLRSGKKTTGSSEPLEFTHSRNEIVFGIISYTNIMEPTKSHEYISLNMQPFHVTIHYTPCDHPLDHIFMFSTDFLWLISCLCE